MYPSPQIQFASQTLNAVADDLAFLQSFFALGYTGKKAGAIRERYIGNCVNSKKQN